MAQILNSFFPLLLPVLLLFNKIVPSASKVYNIAELGAKSDLRTDSAKPLLTAWTAACNSGEPSTVVVPEGRFLVSHATFTGPCKSQKITVEINGELIAPTGYASTAKKGDWMTFNSVNGVSIRGGTINGRGMNLWSCKAKGHHCPAGATVSL